MLYLGMKKKWKNMNGGCNSGAVYGLGLIGALIYYFQHAVTFSDGVMGLIKAIVWPGVLTYKLLEFFRM
jgi:hypothetical protein